MIRFFLNGCQIELPDVEPGEWIGAVLLDRARPSSSLPEPKGLPYLFCGNGSCRDCNLLIEGLADLPACRIPLCDGLSVSILERDCGESALCRIIEPVRMGDGTLETDVLVVGAGPAGRAAAEEAIRQTGTLAVTVVDARHTSAAAGVSSTRAVASVRNELFVVEEGQWRPVSCRAVILATGARDVLHTFPGSTLPGVLPMDLTERLAGLGFLPGSRFVLIGPDARKRLLRRRLAELGAASVRLEPVGMTLVAVDGKFQAARARFVGSHPRAPSSAREEKWIDADTVVVAGRRVSSLALARAMGCSIVYDRDLQGDRVDVDETGRSSVPGVFVCGEVARPGMTTDEAWESGRRAGQAASRGLGASS